jgi:hypothetical protein
MVNHWAILPALARTSRPCEKEAKSNIQAVKKPKAAKDAAMAGPSTAKWFPVRLNMPRFVHGCGFFVRGHHGHCPACHWLRTY